MKISDDQLGTIIADQIRKSGLNDIFDDSVMESIKQKLKDEYRRMKSLPEELIPEGEALPATNSFPYEEEQDTMMTTPVAPAVEPALEAGAEPTGQAYPPKVFTPELPDVLRNVEAEKLVVMELNDITENGENLSNKPFRSMDNIDEKSSMLDLWKSKGCSKAEVYIIKFEKAGDITFDYANGTSVFTPSSQVDHVDVSTSGEFKDNPYKDANPNGPSNSVGPSASEIEAYVKSAVNVEDVVKKVTIDLLAKAHDEKVAQDAKGDMMLSEPSGLPAPVYEAFMMGNSVKDVKFLRKTGDFTHYSYKDQHYIISDNYRPSR
jgi:hypothetical protein